MEKPMAQKFTVEITLNETSLRLTGAATQDEIEEAIRRHFASSLEDVTVSGG
jgi:hypothetical protein